MKEHNIFEKIVFVIDCVLALSWFAFLIANLFKGINNHDVYYLVLSIIEYGFLELDLKNIKKYLDIKD